MTVTELYYCKRCKKLVDPIIETGYESGPNPDAYEDYYKCPSCGAEVVSEYELETDAEDDDFDFSDDDDSHTAEDVRGLTLW